MQVSSYLLAVATARLSTVERREQITDATLELIARHGIASLSTRRVATAVGLTTGALFRHFSSLDAILESVADRVVELLRSTHPPAELPPLERLALFFEARSALAIERSAIPRLVLSEQFSHALPERARRALRRAVRDTHALTEELLREGQRSGVVRDDVGPEALAHIVIGAIQMFALHARLRTRGGVGAEGLRSALLRLLEPPSASARRKRR
jgi:AcrR family transcriptional regulator